MSQSDLLLCRFTVLHHTGVDEPHFDFLFETSPTSDLITFRLHSWPIFENQPVTRLRDHRRAYLTYVGQISGDRGRVDRVDEGRLRVREQNRGLELDMEDGRPFLRLEPVQGAQPEEWMLILKGQPGEMSA